MDSGQIVILCSTLAGVITTLAGFWFSSKRENDRHRNALELEKERRAWDLADRERARAVMALGVEQRALVLERKLDSQHQATVNAVQRVSDIDDKIARLSRMFMDGRVMPASPNNRLDEVSETLDRVEQNTEKTVNLLQDNVSGGDVR